MGDFMSLGRPDNGLRMKPDQTVTLKVSVPGHGEMALDVPGATVEDAEATFIQWLEGDEDEGAWRTIYATVDGQHKKITFRASWVAAFSSKLNRSGGR